MLNLPKPEKVIALAESVKVMSQTAELVPFILNAEQISLVNTICENANSTNICVLKARQLGISTILCFLDVLVAVLNDNVNVGIVVHTQATASGLLDKCKKFAKALGLTLLSENQSRIEFSNGSRINAITAAGGSETSGSRVGRSTTYQWLHLSELAFWPNSEAFPALLATSVGCPVICESSADGKNNILYTVWESKKWHNVFFGVEAHENYQLPANNITDATWERLKKEYLFTSRTHAAWWWDRLPLVGGDEQRQKKEYPVVPAHPFETSSYRYIKIDTVVGEPIERIRNIDIWGKSSLYLGQCIIAVDVSAGTGRDSSAVVVLDASNSKLLASWSDNEAEFNELTQVIDTLYKYYQPANSVIVEQNGVGAGLIVMLQNQNIPVYKLVTTATSQQLGLQATKLAIENKQLVVGPQRLFDEVNSLHINKNDRFAGKKDMCMALGFAYNWLRNNQYRPPMEYKDEQVYYRLPSFKSESIL